jgi:hypothetical protein
MNCCKNVIFLLLSIFAFTGAFAQHPVGIFDNHEDIGNPKMAGSAAYDEATQSYAISGAGSNIWFNRDEFQYVYKKIGGDFILTADFAFTGETVGAIGHRKIGWMIRESVEEGAASMNACKHIDGLTVLQWRPYKGMFMRDPEEEIFAPKKGGQTIQLERIGKKITMRIAHPGEPLQTVGTAEMELKDSVLVGLFICSHDSDAVANAKVWNVRIDRPAFSRYTSNPHAPAFPEPIISGNRLETVDIFDGTRKVIRESASALEVSGQRSAENAQLYTSDSTGTMQIWRKRAVGSGKEQLTFDEYNNWFPERSPDGKWIAFLSFPVSVDPANPPVNQQALLRLMPASGGAPRVIAYFCGGKGSLNGFSWSADSRSLSFVSHF